MEKLESTREKDSNIEKEVCKFCDKYLYSDLTGIQLRRSTSVEEQMSGIDGYLSIPSKGIFDAPADEKAAMHYVNKRIPTFALELSQITVRGEEVDGWFMNDDYKTEYYILMYLEANVLKYTDKRGRLCYRWHDITEHNLKSVEYYIVEKSKIVNYLSEKGYDREKLLEDIKYVRENPEEKYKLTEARFKYFICNGEPEKAINMLLRKEIYLNLCVTAGKIGPDANEIYK